MAVYKLQLKNKQFSILSTAWDKGKSIYKRLKGWLSKKPALIPKGPASDVVYNATNGAAKVTQDAAKKSGGYLRGTQDEYIEALRNRKQAARNGAKGGNNGANNNAKGNNGGAKGGNANNSNVGNGNVKNNQNQNQPKGKGNKKPAVYDAGNGRGITFNKARTGMPNTNGFTTTLSGNPYDLGGYSGFKYVYK